MKKTPCVDQVKESFQFPGGRVFSCTWKSDLCLLRGRPVAAVAQVHGVSPDLHSAGDFSRRVTAGWAIHVFAQVLTEYSNEQLPMVLEATERLEAHLTAAVVSNDPVFTQKVTAPPSICCQYM